MLLSGVPSAEVDNQSRSSPPTMCVAATEMSNGPYRSRSSPGARSKMLEISMSKVRRGMMEALGAGGYFFLAANAACMAAVSNPLGTTPSVAKR